MKTLGIILGWAACGLAGAAILVMSSQPAPDHLAILFAGVFFAAGVTLIVNSGKLPKDA